MRIFNSLRSCLRTAGCAALSAALIAGSGCGKKKESIGFLYVGTKDDNGYNQAFADAATAIKGMPDSNVVEAESIKETEDCEQTMSTMVEQSNAKVVFATSYGYFPHMLTVAKKYPNTFFIHAGGTVKDGDPPNVGTFFAYIDELEYLCGMAAASVSKTKHHKLGYIAAKQILPVERDINAFTLGAKSVDPTCTVTVIFTGEWFLPTKEADAVTTLADQDVDVVTCHVDSPKAVLQAADKRGIYSCGYHYNGAALSPKLYLTGAEWNWAPMMQKFVTEMKSGGKPPHNVQGNLKDGSVKLSPYGPAVTPETQAKIEAVKAQMVAGTFKMFVGPLKNNEGKEVLAAGKSKDDQDWSDSDYLVEGVIKK